MQYLFNFFRRSWIFNRKTKTPESHIKHLILMANIDGEYHYKENDYLQSFARQSRISDSVISKIRSNLGQIDFTLSDDKNERFKQLFNFIEMMMADGRIREEEYLLCKQLAEMLDFKKEVIRDLIEAIQSNLTVGHNVHETRQRVLGLIKFNA